MPGTELSPRRRQLLETAVEVVADHGMRGLTHRAIDRRARLPEGSCSSYFRTRSSLQRALAGFVAARLNADVQGLSTELVASAGRLDLEVTAIRRLFTGWLGTPALLVAKVELTMEASRDPELAAIFGGWRRELVQLVDDVMDAVGREHSSAHAEALVAALDGVLLGALLQAADDQAEYLNDCLAQLMLPLLGNERDDTH
ncbi:hypothetical protein ASG90_04890 [Nocardioides sp. Soil797]|nr:hypothetical protein ASG90_04890 [Nocardioides sp. Soil797]